MLKRQIKNTKERNRVKKKRRSLETLRTLILQNQCLCHHSYEPQPSVKRWTEYFTLKKTYELIKHLEFVLATKGVNLDNL